MEGTGRNDRETVGQKGFYGTPCHRGFARIAAPPYLGLFVSFHFVGLFWNAFIIHH
jgi:hypothetical protein